jgi:hypothetical protein
MTCVWDSIINGLSDLFKKTDNGSELYDIISPILKKSEFIIFCEKHCDYMLAYQNIINNKNNISDKNIINNKNNINDKNNKNNKFNYESVLLNNEPVSRQEIEVCIKRIKELDQIDKQDGYNVGAADSFLLFICIFFRINIIHTGQAHYITIDNKPYSPSMISKKHLVKCEYRPFTCTYTNLDGSGEWIKLNSTTNHMSYNGCGTLV